MKAPGMVNTFDEVYLLDGVRTSWVDSCGALSSASTTDLGSVITGNMAPGDYGQFLLPRHIGLYAGVPHTVPARMAQRICGNGSGFTPTPCRAPG